MKVFLFKASPEDMDKPDKFEVALNSSSFIPEIIPVLAFDFCNLKYFVQKLQNPSNYQGIIFTSPRSVQSVKISVQHEVGNNLWESKLKNTWAQKKWIFCVGPATAEAVGHVFENPSKVIISEDGNAESLGAKIVDILKTSTNPDLPLLYPCGNLKRDMLQNILSEAGIVTDPITVYETVENPNLKYILSEKAIDMGLVSTFTSPFVFFSPSGITFSLKYLTHSLLVQNNRPLIALGPSTKDALLKIEGVDPNNVFQCSRPNIEGLLEVLKSLGIKQLT